MNEFHPFAIERLLSRWENVVDYDLSESGVLPVTLRELLAADAIDADLLDLRLTYAQTNGIEPLRERIAALYPGATADNVLVTVGAAEANYLALCTVVEPGDEIVVMLPNYMQIWGIAQNRVLHAKAFHLVEESASARFSLLVHEADVKSGREALADLLAPHVDSDSVHTLDTHYESGRYVKCPACGTELGSGAAECAECGLTLGAAVPTCARCDSPLAEEGAECTACGGEPPVG